MKTPTLFDQILYIPQKNTLFSTIGNLAEKYTALSQHVYKLREDTFIWTQYERKGSFKQRVFQITTSLLTFGTLFLLALIVKAIYRRTIFNKNCPDPIVVEAQVWDKLNTDLDQKKLSYTPHQPSSSAFTILAMLGKWRLLDFLLENADYNQVEASKHDWRGLAPIHYAAYMGNTIALEKMLNAKVSIDLASSEGKTPLIFAVQEKKNEAIRLLLNKNCNVFANIPNSAIAFAAKENDIDLIQLLVENADHKGIKGDEFDRHGFAPIHYAAFIGSLSALQKILNENEELVNLPTKSGKTALMLAIIEDERELMPLLLASRCNVFAGLREHAITIAVEKNDWELVEYLLDQADHDQIKGDEVDYLGRSVIHYAAMANCLPLLKQMLEKGVSIDLKSGQGKTPLEYAIDRKKIATIEFLLEHNCTVTTEMVLSAQIKGLGNEISEKLFSYRELLG